MIDTIFQNYFDLPYVIVEYDEFSLYKKLI